MSLVTKVRDTAGSVYGQAKARYAGSDTMQKAGRQAGQAAGQAAGKIREISGKAAASQTAGKIREITGKAAATPTAGKIREISGKATSAVKNARPRRTGQQ